MKVIAPAIKRCISLNIPFAYAMLPGCADGRFFAAPKAVEAVGDGFMVRGFEINPSTPPLLIRAEWTTEYIMSLPADFAPLPASEVAPRRQSTEYSEYIAGVDTVINTLKNRGGKTVISRLICAYSEKDICEVISGYFGMFGHTMRFVYFTPQTGLWFGCTPELVIDYDHSSHRLMTMSLAGTRPALQSSSGQWDKKNIDEHQYVTDFIISTLKEQGLDSHITDSTPVRFGAIEHLCDRIEAIGAIDPIEVLGRLCPTPALCGIPVEMAYHQIVSTEAHKRHCYGGWVGIYDQGSMKAFVNLRSALAAPTASGFLYNIYSGGGITASSIAPDEWLETERKSAPLRSLLAGPPSNNNS